MGRRMQKMNNFHSGSRPQRMWRTMTSLKERIPGVDELPDPHSCPPALLTLQWSLSGPLARSRALQHRLSFSPQGSRWRGGGFQHFPQTPFSGCFQLAVRISHIGVCVHARFQPAPCAAPVTPGCADETGKQFLEEAL